MINKSALQSSMLTSTPTLRGPTNKLIVKGVANAVYRWMKIPGNVLIIGSTNGAAGSGQVLGKLFFPPTASTMRLGFTANGLLGPTAKTLATGIGMGLCVGLNTTAQYKGTSTGAIGADISKVVFANGATLLPLLKSNLQSVKVRGITSNLLCTAISAGVTGIILTGTGTGVSVGPAGPAPSTGISRSKIF